MKYLHTMLRISDIEASLRFFCEGLGLKILKRKDYFKDKFTLIFLAAPGDESAQIELTYNWDPDYLYSGRNFGHIAYRVQNIYETCAHLQALGIKINRPPRDGHMAFVRSPDGISVELLQAGEPLPKAEPWASMPNIGSW
ncbi:MAG: lactoylglutathione lyase [Pseudoalteromonas tetraodonis]|jgi:lactoylglutathione lyase|uniref:VOC family protein n=1 Tax=Pseudoalteromonas tetraodonis TaxID=43659 RepID=UPI0039899210